MSGCWARGGLTSRRSTDSRFSCSDPKSCSAFCVATCRSRPTCIPAGVRCRARSGTWMRPAHGTGCPRRLADRRDSRSSDASKGGRRLGARGGLRFGDRLDHVLTAGPPVSGSQDGNRGEPRHPRHQNRRAATARPGADSRTAPWGVRVRRRVTCSPRRGEAPGRARREVVLDEGGRRRGDGRDATAVSVAAGRPCQLAGRRRAPPPSNSSASAAITGRAGTGVGSATIENCTAAALGLPPPVPARPRPRCPPSRCPRLRA